MFVKLLPFSGLIFILASCNQQDPCRHKSGHKAKELRTLPTFHFIKIRNHIPIALIQDSSSQATIYADNGNIPFIQTEVQNDTLFIWNNNKCSWLRHYDSNISIEIKTKELKSILQEGSGDINLQGKWELPKLSFHSVHYSGNVSLEDIHIDSLFYYEKVSGSCFLKVTGDIKYGYLFMRGTGSIDATHLNSQTLHLSSYSYGTMYARAPNHLLAEIHYYGDIVIWGNPQPEKVDITGFGNYIKK